MNSPPRQLYKPRRVVLRAFWFFLAGASLNLLLSLVPSVLAPPLKGAGFAFQAVRPPHDWSFTRRSTALRDCWTVIADPLGEAALYASSTEWPSAVAAEIGSAVLSPAENSRKYSVYFTFGGWPMRCFWGQYQEFRIPNEATDAQLDSIDSGGAAPAEWFPNPEGVLVLQTESGSRFIPVRPIWPALIANSILFTALFFALNFAASLAWSVYTVPPGHCRGCRHRLLVGQPKCPECGRQA